MNLDLHHNIVQVVYSSAPVGFFNINYDHTVGAIYVHNYLCVILF